MQNQTMSYESRTSGIKRIINLLLKWQESVVYKKERKKRE